MSQNRILLIVGVLACGLVLALPGCDDNPLPAWEDPWPSDASAPAISSVSPDSGANGASVTLNGSDMNATADNNFVLIGAGTGLYLAAPSAASGGTAVTITLPEGVDNLPFDEWTIIDTLMGHHFITYPDSVLASIDTVRNFVDDADSLYDSSWTVYAAPETVTTNMQVTSEFMIKMSARGSELWSNDIAFNVIPPAIVFPDDYRWSPMIVISKGE